MFWLWESQEIIWFVIKSWSDQFLLVRAFSPPNCVNVLTLRNQEIIVIKKPIPDQFLLVRSILLPQNHFPVSCTVQKWIPAKKYVFFTICRIFWICTNGFLQENFNIYFFNIHFFGFDTLPTPGRTVRPGGEAAGQIFSPIPFLLLFELSLTLSLSTASCNIALWFGNPFVEHRTETNWKRWSCLMRIVILRTILGWSRQC